MLEYRNNYSTIPVFLYSRIPLVIELWSLGYWDSTGSGMARATSAVKPGASAP